MIPVQSILPFWDLQTDSFVRACDSRRPHQHGQFGSPAHTHTLSFDAMSACLSCHAIQIVLGIAFRTRRQHVATHWGCAVEPGLLYEAGPHMLE